jgi:methyltransferase (TIGR00027 family)
LLRAVTENAIDAVVNLGAGLDARPYRLALPPALRWVDVDAPSVLDFKASILVDCVPVCARESVPLDIADPIAIARMVERIGQDARRALVLTEGILVYLTALQVTTLARTLAARPSFQYWLSDLLSPAGLRLMQPALEESFVGDGRVVLQFAPEQGPAFFRPSGWEVVETLSCVDASLRLNRPFLAPSAGYDSIPEPQRSHLRRVFTVIKLERAR